MLHALLSSSCRGLWEPFGLPVVTHIFCCCFFDTFFCCCCDMHLFVTQIFFVVTYFLWHVFLWLMFFVVCFFGHACTKMTVVYACMLRFKFQNQFGHKRKFLDNEETHLHTKFHEDMIISYRENHWKLFKISIFGSFFWKTE